VMTYQLLTGKLPFTGESFVEIVVKQTSHEPLSPSQICEDIPEPMSSAILWMLKKDPAERPQTLASAVARLEEGASAMGFSVHTGVTGMPTGLEGMARPMGMATPTPATTGGGAATNPDAARGAVTTGGGMKQVSQSFTPIAAGEIAPPDQFESKKSGRTGLWIGVAAVALLGAGGAFFALGRGGGETRAVAQPEGPKLTEPPGVDKPVVDKPAEPPVVDKAIVETPPPPVVPRTIALVVTGAPDGTEVHDEAGVLLGKVPGTLTLPRGDAPMTLRFERAGYEARIEKQAVDQDGTLAVSLHRKKKTPDKGSGLPDF
jgi:hypothetical protein